ncbi:MAG: DUF2169 domain-containing protein [Bacteroidota bacterium]
MPDGLVNESPFAAQELFLTDEDGRDLLVVVVKATYSIGAAGLHLASEPVPVDVAGTYHGDPETASLRFEPEIAPQKVGTDVVLVGHAFPNAPGARWVDVGLRVGPLNKVIRAFGDRHWYRTLGFSRISEPALFDRIPLRWELAFGGWDRSDENPEQHRVEARNPVGVGFQASLLAGAEEGTPLPNLEHPQHLIDSPTDVPPPAGFGFIGPHWAPRLQYAGTYDAAWERDRLPLLPLDFDRRFYNAAPPDQVLAEPLRGDEPVVVAHATPGPWLHFHLPGEPPPTSTVVIRRQADQALNLRLDTVIIDTDYLQVHLLWRAALTVPQGPYAVQAIRVRPHPASTHAAPAQPLVSLS